jgi:photosystem II stability/assembly factor-like uncharacterized protein
MKKTILLFVFTFIYLFPFAQNCEWEWNYSKPIGDRLEGVFMTDSNTVYAIGSAGVIYKSKDFGKNWDKSPIPCTGGHYIFFVDKENGYVVADNGLLKTTDAGKTWLLTNYPGDWRSNIFFTTKDIGYVNNDNLFKTIDGGKTWSQILTLIYNNSIFEEKAVFFENKDLGYVGNGYSKISKTTNGGNSWVNLSFKSIIDSVLVHQIYFNANFGYISCAPNGWGDSENALIKTIDGGINWQKVITPPGFSNKFLFLSPDTGILTGYFLNTSDGKHYEFIKTTDGGNTWSFLQENTWDNYYSDFTDITYSEGRLFSVGMSIMAKSYDYGTNFLLASDTPITDGLSAITFCTPKNGFILLQWSSGYMQTQDSAKTWIIKHPEIRHPLNVCFVDSLYGYICAWDTLWKTANGGNTWDQVLGFNSWIFAMQFVSRDTGYVAGLAGKVFKTVDGGHSFTQIREGNDNEIVYRLRIKGKMSYIFMNNSTSGRSTDCSNNDGLTWGMPNPPNISSIRDIFFTSDSIGYISGYDNNNKNCNFKTADGGKTWNKLFTKNFWPGKYDFDEYPGILYFLNDTIGFLGNPWNSCLRTLDGGKTWSYHNSGIDLRTSMYSDYIDFENIFCFTSENVGYFLNPAGCVIKLKLTNERSKWPNKDAVWYYSFTNIDKEGYIKMYPTKDTIIDDFQFTKFQKSCTYYDYMKQQIETIDMGTVFLRENWGDILWFKDSKIYKLYDFKGLCGESWEVPSTFSQCTDNPYFEIQSKEIVNINGRDLIKLNFKSTSYNPYYSMGSSAIETIGSIDGYFFPTPTLNCNIGTENHGGPFRCYEDPVLGLYSSNMAPYCDYTIGIEEDEVKYPLHVFPNPANNFAVFDYKIPEGTFLFQLFDSRGGKIKEKIIEGGETSTVISTSDLNSGLYFYHIRLKSTTISGKFLIYH